MVRRPGTSCQLRYTLPMNQHVVVVAEQVDHIVVVADENLVVEEITAGCIAAVVATASVDHTFVVAVQNVAGNTHQILKTRWISRVWISLTVLVPLDSLDTVYS